MPARVVVVHDEPEFVDQLATALGLAGHQVATFPDPLTAWDALEAARRVEVLITRIVFSPANQTASPSRGRPDTSARGSVFCSRRRLNSCCTPKDWVSFYQSPPVCQNWWKR